MTRSAGRRNRPNPVSDAESPLDEALAPAEPSDGIRLPRNASGAVGPLPEALRACPEAADVADFAPHAEEPPADFGAMRCISADAVARLRGTLLRAIGDLDANPGRIVGVGVIVGIADGDTMHVRSAMAAGEHALFGGVIEDQWFDGGEDEPEIPARLN